MGLVVDFQKCGESEASNDSNTARRTFINEDAFPKIKGINKEIIVKFHLNLICIIKRFEIKISNSRLISVKTAKALLVLHASSLNNILIHGPEIIVYLVLPKGLFNEETRN